MRSLKSRVVVNADDLGVSQEVNDRVFELMSKRAITSATIMANGPFAESALRRAREFPEHSFGVHLNLTDFEPLSEKSSLRPLLRDDGTFMRNAIRRTAFSADLIRGIARELDRQIEKVKRWDIPISHVDSHHHVHTIPRLFFTLKAVQRHNDIERIRISRNLYEVRLRSSMRVKKQLWNSAVRYVTRTRTTDIFTDLSTFVRVAPKISGSVTVELCVHPGNPDFLEEDRLLETDWWLQLPSEIELVSYNQI